MPSTRYLLRRLRGHVLADGRNRGSIGGCRQTRIEMNITLFWNQEKCRTSGQRAFSWTGKATFGGIQGRPNAQFLPSSSARSMDCWAVPGASQCEVAGKLNYADSERFRAPRSLVAAGVRAKPQGAFTGWEIEGGERSCSNKRRRISRALKAFTTTR